MDIFQYSMALSIFLNARGGGHLNQKLNLRGLTPSCFACAIQKPPRY